MATWQNENLPSDRMSTENATILTNCERWPLMIDPQLQGIKWIKTREGEELRVVRLGQKGYWNIEKYFCLLWERFSFWSCYKNISSEYWTCLVRLEVSRKLLSDADVQPQKFTRMYEFISAFRNHKFCSFCNFPWLLHPKNQNFHQLLSFTSSLDVRSQFVSGMISWLLYAVIC